MVAMLRRYADFCLHPAQGDRLMIERGLGYWITPDGQSIPTPPAVSHADLMRGLIDEAELDEGSRDAFVRDPNAYALSKGWSRVRIYPSQQVVYLDMGQGQRTPHRRLTDRLLDQLGLVGLTVKYTDEEGNYVS